MTYKIHCYSRVDDKQVSMVERDLTLSEAMSGYYFWLHTYERIDVLRHDDTLITSSYRG